MRKKVYLDNAATSWPKPDSVYQAMQKFMSEIGCSPGRGGYEGALQAGRLVLDARIRLADLFKVSTPEHIVFTHNATHALNYAFKGLLHPGDHVLTSAMEHNAVVRPLRHMAQEGVISLDIVPCSPEGLIDVAALEALIRADTRMLVATHASNVTGTLQPVDRMGQIAVKHNLYYIIDAAQTAGIYSMDLSALHADVIVFTGHKALLGPAGTGGMALSTRAGHEMRPLLQGGTGSTSDLEYQPPFLPDKLESGTLNTPGIVGLRAGVAYVQDKGLSHIRAYQQGLTRQLTAGLRQLPRITVYGPQDALLQASTVSIDVKGEDLGEMSYILDDTYGIMTRSGLHCAPLAHKTIGTFPKGTLRFSIGYFNTCDEIDYVLEVLSSWGNRGSSPKEA